MSYNSVSLKFDLLRTVSATTFSGSFIKIGEPFSVQPRIIKISNNTNVDVFLSVDGEFDYDFVASGGFVLYDAGANRGESAPSMSFDRRTQFFVRGMAGTGDVYLTVLFGENQEMKIPGM